MTRRGRPRETGHRPLLGPHQVLQVFADRLRVAQIVVLLNQAVEQGLLGCPPDLLEAKGTQIWRSRRSGVRSISSSTGTRRRVSGLGGVRRCVGNSMRPARCKASIKPRHTMSCVMPLGCSQLQASHSLVDRARRLRLG